MSSIRVPALVKSMEFPEVLIECFVKFNDLDLTSRVTKENVMDTQINRVSAMRWRVREFRQSLRFILWRVSFTIRAAWLGYRIRHEF